MNTDYSFNSKETYIAASKAWKEYYAQLTIEARAARRVFAATAREFSKTGSYHDANLAYLNAYKVMAKARRSRDNIRNDANSAMITRAEMKVEASRQWMAEHVTTSV